MLFKYILPLNTHQLQVVKADGQNKLETANQASLRSSPLADLSRNTSQWVVRKTSICFFSLPPSFSRTKLERHCWCQSTKFAEPKRAEIWPGILAESILIPCFCKHYQYFKLPVKKRAFIPCTNYSCVVWRPYMFVFPIYVAEKIQPSPGTRRLKATRFLRSDGSKKNILCSC